MMKYLLFVFTLMTTGCAQDPHPSPEQEPVDVGVGVGVEQDANNDQTDATPCPITMSDAGEDITLSWRFNGLSQVFYFGGDASEEPVPFSFEEHETTLAAEHLQPYAFLLAIACLSGDDFNEIPNRLIPYERPKVGDCISASFSVEELEGAQQGAENCHAYILLLCDPYQIEDEGSQEKGGGNCFNANELYPIPQAPPFTGVRVTGQMFLRAPAVPETELSHICPTWFETERASYCRPGFYGSILNPN